MRTYEDTESIRKALHREVDCAIDDLIASADLADHPTIQIQIDPALVEQLRSKKA